jgi:hypothetical protein
MDAPKCRLCGERHWGGCKKIEAAIRSAVDLVTRCPVCEARRETKAKAMKRYRAKKLK